MMGIINKRELSALKGLSIALGLAFSQHAAASLYTFETSNPAGNPNSGKIDHIMGSYDSSAQDLTWNVDFSDHNGNLPNGYWLVLSDGPNPKTHVNEYSILYADTLNNRLSAYVYNGVNSSNSWNTPGELITMYDGVLDVVDGLGTRSINFTIDASAINDYTPANGDPNDWDGVSFDDSIGVWFHPVVLNDVSYFEAPPIFGDVGAQLTQNQPSGLASFSYSTSGWYDTGGQSTTVTTSSVPEPGTLALLTGGLIGAAAVRSRRKKREGIKQSEFVTA